MGKGTSAIPPLSTTTLAAAMSSWCPATRRAAAAARAARSPATGPPHAVHLLPKGSPVPLTRLADLPLTLGWVTIQRQSFGTRTSGPLKNTTAADPPPTPTVRQSAKTGGSGPLETWSPQSHIQPLRVPPLRRGRRHLCVPSHGRVGCQQGIRSSPPLRAGGEEGEGRQASELASPPSGQASWLQVLRRRGFAAKWSSLGRRVQSGAGCCLTCGVGPGVCLRRTVCFFVEGEQELCVFFLWKVSRQTSETWPMRLQLPHFTSSLLVLHLLLMWLGFAHLMQRPFHSSEMDILPLDGERPLLLFSPAFAAHFGHFYQSDQNWFFFFSQYVQLDFYQYIPGGIVWIFLPICLHPLIWYISTRISTIHIRMWPKGSVNFTLIVHPCALSCTAIFESQSIPPHPPEPRLLPRN